jgi:hypothetical protein
MSETASWNMYIPSPDWIHFLVEWLQLFLFIPSICHEKISHWRGLYGSESWWWNMVQLMTFTVLVHSPLVPPLRSPAFRSGGTCLRKQSSRKFAMDRYRCRITPFKLWLSSGYIYRKRIRLPNFTLNSLDPKLVIMTVGCGISHTIIKIHIQYHWSIPKVLSNS